jgi:hypothetical protein
MTNINVELKGPKGPQIAESLVPAAVSGYQRGLAVTYGADVSHAALVAVAGAVAIGLIEEDAVSLQLPIRVIEFGQTVAQIGAAVNAQQLLTPNANGQLIPAGPGQAVVAIALETRPNAGDYLTVFVVGPGGFAPGDTVTHYTAAGAIPIASGTAGIGSAGALAMTLAAPTALQDGTEIFISAETAHAHTVTTPANGINGTKHVVTFSAQGDGIVLEALNGIWNVRALIGTAALS